MTEFSSNSQGSDHTPWAPEGAFQRGGKPDNSQEAQEEQEFRERPWIEALHGVSPNLKEDVQRTVRRWNQTVRSHLRDETGFRLAHGNSRSSVPVVVSDGIPRPFWEFADRWSGLAPILLRLPLLEKTSEGLRFVAESREILDPIIKGGNWPDRAELSNDHVLGTQSYVDALIDRVKREEAVDQMTSSPEDVLGCYFFLIPRVHLFWMPIGIISLSLGLSVESVTVVVLAHELAHAYTHLGRDIDGGVWRTKDFANSDLRIVEGLAEHYAEVICKRLEYSLPSAITAFDVLSKKSSPIYTDYKNWLTGKPRKSPGEVMRAAMLAFRQSRKTHYDDFIGLLANDVDGA